MLGKLHVVLQSLFLFSTVEVAEESEEAVSTPKKRIAIASANVSFFHSMRKKWLP